MTYPEIRDDLIVAAEAAGLDILDVEEGVEVESLTKTFVLYVGRPGEDEQLEPMVAQLSFTTDPVAEAAADLTEELFGVLESEDVEGEASQENPSAEDEEPGTSLSAHELEVRYFFPVPDGQDGLERARAILEGYARDVDPEYEPTVVLSHAVTAGDERDLVDSFLAVGWLLETAEDSAGRRPSLIESILEEVAQTLELLEKVCRG